MLITPYFKYCEGCKLKTDHIYSFGIGTYSLICPTCGKTEVMAVETTTATGIMNQEEKIYKVDPEKERLRILDIAENKRRENLGYEKSIPVSRVADLIAQAECYMRNDERESQYYKGVRSGKENIINQLKDLIR